MKVAAVLAGVMLGVVAIFALRAATQSTHEPVDPDSQLEIVMHVESNRAEAGQTLAEMAEAQLLVCRLEVGSDPIGPVESLGDNRFRAVLTPSLDTTDRRQFRGCLEDWVIDHTRIDVERLDELT